LTLAGLSTEVATDAARLRPSEIATASGDSRRAQRLLGWAPSIPWRQTLADVLADWAHVCGSRIDKSEPVEPSCALDRGGPGWWESGWTVGFMADLFRRTGRKCHSLLAA